MDGAGSFFRSSPLLIYDQRFVQSVGAQAACKNKGSIENRLQSVIVRHGFEMQIHRELDFNRVTGLPCSDNRKIATRACRDVGLFTIYFERRW